MLRFVHTMIVYAYLAAPALAVLGALFQRRRNSPALFTRLFATASIAIVMGSAVALACALAGDGRISAGQLGLCVYLTASLLVLIAALDNVLLMVLKRLWHLARGQGTGATLWRKFVESLPFLIRATVLIAIALPYLMAVALTFRPKVVPRADPANQLGLGFDLVRFETRDGYVISGWWIPAARRDTTRQRHRPGRDTVILCHGIGASKSSMLAMAHWLVPRGYNVLMFDFRAHGQSDGQLTSLGMLEKQDVLAAVRWLRANHSRQSRRILGLGISTGAAALIEAAADDSIEGRAIDALAVYECFDDLRDLGRTVATTRFLPPLSWFADRVALPLASAQVGADLLHLSPADSIKKLWPRPVLVIHGSKDGVVPIEYGERLYDAAFEPKRCLWLPGEDYGQAIQSKAAALEVNTFFDEAQPVPAI